MSIQIQAARECTRALPTRTAGARSPVKTENDVPEALVREANICNGVPEIHVHGVRVAREGAARYAQFAHWLECRGDAGVSRLFAELARREAECLGKLQRQTPGEGPELDPVMHSWLFDAAVAEENCAFIFHLATPWHALNIALSAKRTAMAFFEQLALSSVDPDACALASDMAAAQAAQASLLKAALAKAPQPMLPGDDPGLPLLH